jgi:hypothetical protein
MSKITQSFHLLIQIGQWLCDEAEDPTLFAEEPNQNNLDITKAIKTVQDELSDFELSRKDIELIAVLINRTLEMQRQGVPVYELLDLVWTEPDQKISNVDCVRTLTSKRIFEPSEKQYRRKNADSHCVELKLDRFTMLFAEVKPHPNFMKRLLGEPVIDPEQIAAPYRNNEEFLRDQFAYVETLQLYNAGRASGLDENDVMTVLERLAECENRIQYRLQKTTGMFPLLDLIQEYELDRKEQAILIYLLKEDINGNSCTKDELLDLISEDQVDRYRNSRYLDENSRLRKNRLIETSRGTMFNLHLSEIRLSPNVTAELIGKSPQTENEKIAEIIGSNSLLSVSNPSMTLDQLVLPPDLMETLKVGITQCRDDIGQTLLKWGLNEGVFAVDGKTRPEYRTSMLLLFHGLPGTGKTFAARALASALGKKLVQTDVSKILSHWVGQSEQNIRRLFAVYEQLIIRSENPPVLLLNECDQFLAARGNAEKAVDRMYNQMQNLFLEALERFRGILIATTNLRENLDKAFSRRFHLKLEFPFPGVNERRALWKIHLPGSMPVSNDVDLNRLAQDYELTGGQIAVVVKNAAVEAAGSQRKKLTMALL